VRPPKDVLITTTTDTRFSTHTNDTYSCNLLEVGMRIYNITKKLGNKIFETSIID